MIKDELTENDFKSLEVLSKIASKKKYFRKFLEFCFLLKNKSKVLEDQFKTPVANQFWQDLEIKESDAHQLVLSTIKIIIKCSQRNFKNTLDLFPNDFPENVKKNISDILGIYAEIWEKQINNEISQADKLLDFDWRLDMQLISQDSLNKKSEPIVFFELETINGLREEGRNNLVFQMNGQDLGNFYNNLKKIKEQLNLLVSE